MTKGCDREESESCSDDKPYDEIMRAILRESFLPFYFLLFLNQGFFVFLSHAQLEGSKTRKKIIPSVPLFSFQNVTRSEMAMRLSRATVIQ